MGILLKYLIKHDITSLHCVQHKDFYCFHMVVNETHIIITYLSLLEIN